MVRIVESNTTESEMSHLIVPRAILPTFVKVSCFFSSTLKTL